MAVGNMHNFGKDRARGSGDVLADKQTKTQTCSSQYFATAAVGKVIIKCMSVTQTNITKILTTTITQRHIS